MDFIRIINAKDTSGKNTNYGIVWETVFMTCTFSLGINLQYSNFLAFFYVSNDGIKDSYQLLKLFYIPAYRNYFPVDSLLNKIKLEMSRKTTEVLTKQYESGMISIEQIRRMQK